MFLSIFFSFFFFFFNQPTCPFKKCIWGCPKHVWNDWHPVALRTVFWIWQHVCIFCSVVMSDLLRTSRASSRRAADPSQQRGCVLRSVPLARTWARSSCGGIRETEEAIQSDWAHSSVLLTCKILSLLIEVINSRSVIGHMVITVPFFNCAVSWIRVQWIGVEGIFSQKATLCCREKIEMMHAHAHKSPPSPVKIILQLNMSTFSRGLCAQKTQETPRPWEHIPLNAPLCTQTRIHAHTQHEEWGAFICCGWCCGAFGSAGPARW